MNTARHRLLQQNELTAPPYERKLPAVITPEREGDLKELYQRISEDKERINALIHTHGGVLFRGFHVERPEDFAEIIRSLGIKLEKYYLGNLTPRNQIIPYIFSSTTADPKVIIYPHNEYAYLLKKPRKLCFFAQHAPSLYGETPLFDCAAVFKSISPELQSELLNKKIRYSRHYPYKESFYNKRLQNTWKKAFETSDKEEIENICKKSGSKCAWQKNGDLYIIDERPGIITHPVTGEQCMHMHLSNEYIQYLLLDILRKRQGFLRHSILRIKLKCFFWMKLNPVNVDFEDGTPLGKKREQELFNAYFSNRTLFSWKKGDILVLDNLRTAHGRMNVVGERKILTCFGDMYNPFKL